MPCRRTKNRSHGNVGIKRDEPPAVVDGQSQQVDVGQLPMAVHPVGTKTLVIDEPDVVGPEFVHR